MLEGMVAAGLEDEGEVKDHGVIILLASSPSFPHNPKIIGEGAKGGWEY
jgi:hypothetical protein